MDTAGLTIAERKVYQEAKRRAELRTASHFSSPHGLVHLFPYVEKAFKLPAKPAKTEESEQ